MAEGGRRSFTASSFRGSDEVFDFTCTPCVQEGKHVEAVNFCADCSEFFCPSCTRHHKKFGVTAGHNVVSTDKADQATSILPTERCDEHAGERISTYCVEHDVVVCSTCLALDHRACKKAVYIPKIDVGQTQTKDKRRVKTKISQSLEGQEQVKLSIQDRQATADKEMNEHLQQIDDTTERLIKHAQTLKKAAVADVVDHHKKTRKELQSEIKSVDDVTAKLKTRLNKLNNTHVTNDLQTFVDIKQGNKEVQDAKQLEEGIKTSGLGQSKTKFAMDDLVDIFLNDVISLGKIIRIKPYKAVPKGKYDVSLEEDEALCKIHDICVFEDGRILMTDFQNSCIKVLDQSNRVSKCVKLPSCPWGICQTSRETVAITFLDDRKVQYVNIVGGWKLTKSFKVDDGCRGITHSNDELLIACGGHPGYKDYDAEGPGFVGIYDMSGTIRQKIQFDSGRRQMFSVPYHIATTSQGGKIHIADKKGGVITVDRRGNVLSRFNINIEWATGVCAISNDSLIVCGYESNNVLQIDTSGNMVAELVSEKNGIDSLITVSMCRNSGIPRLLITSYESNEMEIFDLI